MRNHEMGATGGHQKGVQAGKASLFACGCRGNTLGVGNSFSQTLPLLTSRSSACLHRSLTRWQLRRCLAGLGGRVEGLGRTCYAWLCPSLLLLGPEI